MMQYSPKICRSCARANDLLSACTSFPDGIPRQILMGEADHRESIAGEEPWLFDESKQVDLEDWLEFGNPGVTLTPDDLKE